jgi:chromosome segregation ATPase
VFLLAQLWIYLLAAFGLGIVAGLAVGLWRWARHAERSMQEAEFRHTEQMYSVSAEHEETIAALEAARLEANRALEAQEADTDGLRARIEERDKQIKDLSAMLVRVNHDLAKAEGARRKLVEDGKGDRDEVEALRKQVVASRAELAQALGASEREILTLREQLLAERTARGGGASGPEAAAA